MKALHSNILANSPIYSDVLNNYNRILQEEGHVNNKKFYEEFILPRLPNYHMQSWYKFLKRFRSDAGLEAAELVSHAPVHVTVEKSPETIAKEIEGEGKLKSTLVSNQDATARAVQKALNIANDRLEQIIANPELMTAKEAVDLLFKAMKAQDSRIHAVGKLREDNREQEKFDRAFDEANFQ